MTHHLPHEKKSEMAQKMKSTPKYPGYRKMTGSQRYNARMDKIFEESKRLNEKYHGVDRFGSQQRKAERTLGPNKGFKGTESMNQMGGNTGAKPKK